MARNAEIKARIESVQALLPRVAALAGEGPFELRQDDTFFRCDHGRLKLRDFLDGSGELIFYRRADARGTKESFYLRSPTSTPAMLRESLSLAYGQAGRVVKRRILFLAGRTRIHLDAVDGLGDFLELEVVLGDDEPIAHGVAEADDVMRRLGIEKQQLLDVASVDMLAGQSTSHLP